ncbi:hypothetical protein IFO69_04980 [Echinicola sp. CAU 1574]|uniref:Uncharacterized protein n=1 Tax=Echinicola arenosa TaxID=2774144 RepID=A0ABR9AHV7_9BACT|nr:hypothetical protein [Echinicola arenosa]MBD8488094.1 hypothetical protein [Echinicola arenosa]
MPFELGNIKLPAAMTIIILLVSTLGSGILMIYAFNRPLFLELETVKLILLATSISTPVWLLNTFLIMHFDVLDEESEQLIYTSSISGSLITIGIFFIPIIFQLFYPFPLKCALAGIIVLQLLIIFNWYRDRISRMTPKSDKTV